MVSFLTWTCDMIDEFTNESSTQGPASFFKLHTLDGLRYFLALREALLNCAQSITATIQTLSALAICYCAATILCLVSSVWVEKNGIDIPQLDIDLPEFSSNFKVCVGVKLSMC